MIDSELVGIGLLHVFGFCYTSFEGFLSKVVVDRGNRNNFDLALLCIDDDDDDVIRHRTLRIGLKSWLNFFSVY